MLDKFLLDAINDFSEVLIKQMRKELVAQGHKMTGKLSKSLEAQVKGIASGVRLTITGESYGKALNDGVKKGRIPFSPGSGAGRSKYIQGLQKFVKAKITSDEKKSLGIAFAIAKAHLKEGMPTRSSLRFARNGRRKGWIDFAVKDTQRELDRVVTQVLAKRIERSLVEL